MKIKILLICLWILSLINCSKNHNTKKSELNKNVISFIDTVDIKNATKDGIYMDEYVVNLNYNDIKKLNGKKVKVSGKIWIEGGLENVPKEYDGNGREIKIIRQGREQDKKHIEDPKIEILN